MERYKRLFKEEVGMEVQECENCMHFIPETKSCEAYPEVRDEHGKVVDYWLVNSKHPNHCSLYDGVEIYIEGDELMDEYSDSDLFEDEDDAFIDVDLDESVMSEIELKKKPKGGGKYKKVITVNIDPKTKKKTKVMKWVKVSGSKKAKDKASARKAVKTKKKDSKGRRLAKKKTKKTNKAKKQMGI